MDDRTTFGLAAIGVCGEFTVEMLSTCDGRWLLTIDSRTWWFEFALCRPEGARLLSEFFRSHLGRYEHAEMVVGSFDKADVRVVKDDEFSDRFYVSASHDGAGIRITLTSPAVEDLAGALADAAANFATTPESEGECNGDREARSTDS